MLTPIRLKMNDFIWNKNSDELTPLPAGLKVFRKMYDGEMSKAIPDIEVESMKTDRVVTFEFVGHDMNRDAWTFRAKEVCGVTWIRIVR